MKKTRDKTLSTLDLIKKQQIEWAQRNGKAVNAHGYVNKERLEEDNLFEPLLPDAKAEFQKGSGNEMKLKMRALHSSSALACNVFHYWRLRQKVNVITRALGLESGYHHLKFEKTHKKPQEIGGKDPHLDVEITNEFLIPVAIESKFTEPYEKKIKNFHPKYRGKSFVWQPLAACQHLVDQIISGKEKFYRLDAPQLLKHILGLKEDYKSNFKLYYLWYKVRGIEAEEHDAEIRRFISAIGHDIDFYVMTYQTLFSKIMAFAGDEDLRYVHYLKDRYFHEWIRR